MDEFILPIDAGNFQSTNGTWNDLMLNDPWSVGYVTTLIEIMDFNSKEEWEQFYYNNGKERDSIVAKLSPANQSLLNNYALVRQNKDCIMSLPWDLKNLNYQMGRTFEQLQQRGKDLYEVTRKFNPAITPEECTECVRFRVICETWNGVIMRERNTIIILSRLLPKVEFRKTTGEIDHKYAVDYELYDNDILKCAIQIKPKSYLGNAPYVVKARNANRHKNESYQQLTGVNVYDVISKTNGEILNPQIITLIKARMQS